MSLRSGFVAMAVLALAACGATPTTPEPSLPDPDVPVVAPSELAAQKQAAGIEDCPRSDPDVPVVAPGLPDLVLGCLDGGREVRLAGLRGQPMMINVWAQWCGPCQDEAPFISEVAASNTSEMVILGIDYDDPRPDRAIEFARVVGWTFPQLVDQDRALAGPLQITGPPQTFFVKADGGIAYRHTGPFASAEQIRAQAKRHLGVTL
ncbi:MAG TPA: TlpA disulfide reductase family protein [Propionibacteriaceae bacterium]|nr:TlpA disulfide reductase family protein [Propionibacteriaceae bacterium]